MNHMARDSKVTGTYAPPAHLVMLTLVCCCSVGRGMRGHGSKALLEGDGAAFGRQGAGPHPAGQRPASRVRGGKCAWVDVVMCMLKVVWEEEES